MQAHTNTRPRRRTQEQRSAATRQVVLLAARETICELGYSRTTVAEVALRAGVSRGAQLHHYPSKEKMMLAVADFIFSGVERDLSQMAAQLSKQPGNVDAFINDIWERVFHKENFHPILELVSAARTNPALRELLSVRWQRLIESYDDIWAKVLSQSEHGNPEMVMLLNLTLSLLRGMAFHRVIDEVNQQYYDDLLKAWSSIVKGIVGKESLHSIKIVQP